MDVTSFMFMTTTTTKPDKLAYDSSNPDIQRYSQNPAQGMFPAGSSQGLVEG